MAHMPEFQQPQDEPDGFAEAAVFVAPDNPSAHLTLPEKYAGDVFPITIVTAVVAAPALVIGLAPEGMPWWAVFVLALFVPIEAGAIYVLHRFRWVPPTG